MATRNIVVMVPVRFNDKHMDDEEIALRVTKYLRTKLEEYRDAVLDSKESRKLDSIKIGEGWPSTHNPKKPRSLDCIIEIPDPDPLEEKDRPLRFHVEEDDYGVSVTALKDDGTPLGWVCMDYNVDTLRALFADEQNMDNPDKVDLTESVSTDRKTTETPVEKA